MKKSEALFEDTTMAYNRWTQGIASREQSASKVGLKDILDDKKAQSLDTKTTKNIPLHPTLTQTPALVGGILANLSNLEMKLKAALASNMVEDEEKEAILKTLFLLTRHNRRTTNRMVNLFKKLG